MSISDEARSQIEKLCRKVSVAAELDDSIQRELRDHMHDKLLAYLSGEQRVSEADALLLVKHHFGDVRAIRAMYRKVHAIESSATVARRLVAAAVATLLWMSFVSVSYTALARALDLNPTRRGTSIAMWLAIFIAVALVNLGGMWATLLWWKRRAAKGTDLWFMRMHPAALAVVLLAALGLWIGLPAVFGPPEMAKAGTAHYIARWAVVGVGLLGYSGEFLRALAWTWFCDLSPRRLRELLIGVLAWGCFALATSALSVTWWPEDPMHYTGRWLLTWTPIMLTRDAWIYMMAHAGMAAATMLVLATLIYYGERVKRRLNGSIA
jgi:hypothetical protein